MTPLAIASNILACALIVGLGVWFAIVMVAPHQDAKRKRRKP